MTWLDDCRAYCKQAKYLAEDVSWQDRANHTKWLSATSALLDSSRVTIPHLQFHGEYAPRKNGDPVYRFGLRYVEGRNKERVFQLEVYPAHVNSHGVGPDAMFGPHVHFAGRERKVLCGLDHEHLTAWIKRFVRHTKVIDNPPHRLQHPFAGDLFAR